MIDGSDSKYVNWAIYPDGTTYYLNTDCVKSRTIYVDGKPMTLAPKEMKQLKSNGAAATGTTKSTP